MKYVNIINRIGNKSTDIKFFKHLLPIDVETVVEPFGGSFAVSKLFYQDANRYKFHINDLDETLFYIYQHYDDMIRIYRELFNTYNETYSKKYYDFKNYFEGLDMHPQIKNYIRDTYFVRGSLFKAVKNSIVNPNEELILQQSKITNLDYKDIFEEYKTNENAFLFLDPPYLFSNNSSYIPQANESDMTSIVLDILEFMQTCKCKVMLIINELDILSHLFKDYIKGRYNRVYQLSKKKTVHLIICNY